MITTRLLRGWNQTGQKYAGGPDIVKSYLLTNPRLLWVCIIIEYVSCYLQLTLQLRRSRYPKLASIVLVVMLIAFNFKLSFTNEDAPELVVGYVITIINMIPQLSLLAQAQAALLGICLVGIYAIAGRFLNLHGPSVTLGTSKGISVRPFS
jgi:ethanolamine phosphate transferase 2 subunit G